MFGVASSSAQVVLDGKLGASGPLTGPTYSIPANVGAVRGNNLFHSFSQFNLASGEAATFTGPANIQNVLSRVTGSSPSSIDGTIRSEIAGANLFLINPHGFVFGPNAAVDVTGSFAASSADYLKLEDGARFMASLDADDSLLSSAPVSAFGFLGNTPGGLSVQQSTLSVSDGKEISFIGGDVTLDGGTLRAPGGLIKAVSVQSPGEVPTSGAVNDTLPLQGEVNLRNLASLDGSGEAGGRIIIRGGRLVVDSSKIEANSNDAGNSQGIDIKVAGDLSLSNGGQINSLTPAGIGASGNIAISAGSVRLDGNGLVDDFFNPLTQISASTGDLFTGGGPAKSGDISIRTGSLELINSAQISTATYGAGDAGRIDVEASSVRLDALMFTPTQITANTQQIEGGGKAGDISIRTGTLDLVNGATILAATFGTGAAGVVNITAQTVNILSAGIITAGTFGPSPGGNVQLEATTLRIDGKDTLTGGPDLLTGIQAVTTSPDVPAPGGNLEIKAESIEMSRNATLFTSSFGAGKGGNIQVTAGNLTLENGATIRAAGEAAGEAGMLTVQARDTVTLTERSAISTSAPGSSGGDISVSAGSEIRLIDSQINAQAGLNGGNITVAASGLVYLLESTFTAQADTAGGGFGNGGNLTIDRADFLILNDGSLISKSSLGNGGNITILTDYFFQSGSVIDASAPFGLPGTVQVTAPEVDLSGSLISLPGNFLDAESELRPDCAIRLTGNISSFVVLGRGGLPLQPGGFLPSGLFPPRDETR